MKFSILSLTFNEEVNIPGLFNSISWCDDKVILDSFSTDRTVEVATAFGAKVYKRKFDTFADQRNWAIDNIKFKYPWVFHLDADERFIEDLHKECEEVVVADRHSGYFVPFKMIFHDKWLRHCGVWPGYQMRLMKTGEVRFAQKGHGQREADVKRGLGYLKEPLLHNNFSKGLDDWFEKHNRYSSQEAREAIEQIHAQKIDWTGLFNKNELQRRRALKDLSYRLPGRPWLKFIYMYFLRMGFMDGWEGLTYCRLMAMYEYMIVCKMKEIQRKG